MVQAYSHLYNKKNPVILSNNFEMSSDALCDWLQIFLQMKEFKRYEKKMKLYFCVRFSDWFNIILIFGDFFSRLQKLKKLLYFNSNKIYFTGKNLKQIFMVNHFLILTFKQNFTIL